jgi:hypothetical protein
MKNFDSSRTICVCFWVLCLLTLVFRYIGLLLLLKSKSAPLTPTESAVFFATELVYDEILCPGFVMHDNPVLLYVLFYDEHSRERACELYGMYTWLLVPLFLPTTPLFENEPLHVRRRFLSRRDRWKKREYIGFISWRIFQKVSQEQFDETLAVLADGIDEGPGVPRKHPDVAAFFIGWNGELFPYGKGEICINFTSTWNRVVGLLDHRLVGRPYKIWVSNYWVARPAELEVFANFLDRAIAAFVADGVALQPTTYGREVTDAMRRAGMPAYPLMPFLLERLAPTYYQFVSNAVLWECIPPVA